MNNSKKYACLFLAGRNHGLETLKKLNEKNLIKNTLKQTWAYEIIGMPVFSPRN